MLSLQEHTDIVAAVDILDDQYTDDVIDKAEYYDIEEDVVTLQTRVTIYDADGAVLSTAVVEDYDIALIYMEEVFDLEEIDHDETDSAAAAGGSRFGHG